MTGREVAPECFYHSFYVIARVVCSFPVALSLSPPKNLILEFLTLWNSLEAHSHLHKMFIFCQYPFYPLFFHNSHRGKIREGYLWFILESLAEFPGRGKSLRSNPLYCKKPLLSSLKDSLHKVDSFLKYLPSE